MNTPEKKPKPSPVVNPWARAFWDGARLHKLLIQKCGDCGKHVFYPRIACPHCGSDRLDWVEASGRGTLYSYTVVHNNAPSAFIADMPFVVAVIRLEEGVQMLSNVVECDQGALRCDMPVEVVFEKLNDEFTLPKFRPSHDRETGMTQRKYGDDFKVGDIYRTPRITVTETHVVNWAGLTGDFYPLHMDKVYAEGTQFGERLAHGPLIFGLAVGLVALAGFGEDSVIAWLGVDNMRMHAPVKIGDTVTVVVEVKEVTATSNPRKGIQTWLYTVRNQRDEAVMSFDYKLMFHMRG